MSKIDTEKSPLTAEFLKDHQQFSRLLFQIEKLLDQRMIAEAQQRGRELDKLAGPHIAYEERELYPRLGFLGQREVSQSALVDQHHDAFVALNELLTTDDPDDPTIERIRRGFQRALTHAEHCGSLISLMSRLDDRQQQKSLETLIELRRSGKTWTEFRQSTGR